MDYTCGTVISSRIRLARNVNGYPFPAKLKSDRQAKEIIRAVMSAIDRVDEFTHKYMDEISPDEATNLVENRLISLALLNQPKRSAVLINKAKDISIMINEEDHLREQCIRKGMAIREAYADMSAKDTLIARSLPFAYDEELGYLTACPTNLGTGLRASVMLFLPAISLGGLVPDLEKSARYLGLTVRGAYGEGSEAAGYVYQVSNEVTLGVTENAVLEQVEQFVDKIVQAEASERARLKKGDTGLAIKDRCLRAYGTLTNCALMPHAEFDRLCADLKLAVCLGYVGTDDVFQLDDLTLKMKPSNLNVLAGRVLTPKERDAYRAEYASNKIKSAFYKTGLK